VAEGTALVDIQKGQYTLWGVDGVSRTSRSGVNGLFQLAEGNVLVLTGTKDGPLRLTVETHSQEPPLKLEGWKDIVEVTQRSTTDEVAVAPLFEAPVEGLPKLKVSAGSAIRIRIHARGRDEADKYWGVDEPIEEHLLQMWRRQRPTTSATASATGSARSCARSGARASNHRDPRVSHASWEERDPTVVMQPLSWQRF